MSGIYMNEYAPKLDCAFHPYDDEQPERHTFHRVRTFRHGIVCQLYGLWRQHPGGFAYLGTVEPAFGDSHYRRGFEGDTRQSA